MLEALKAALEATAYPFAHFGWSKAPAGTYGVYAEDGANDRTADDGHAERALTGQVDLFTRDDTDAPRIAVEAALASVPFLSWRLADVLYEEQTGLIHYAWDFEVA